MKKFLIVSGIISLAALSFGKEVVAAPALVEEAPLQLILPAVTEDENIPVPGNFTMFKVDRFTDLAAVPSFSLGAPVGMVPGWGVAFAGLSGRHNSETTDGALALGMMQLFMCMKTIIRLQYVCTSLDLSAHETPPRSAHY
ncbi:MAG: hypothetical protein ACRDB2_03140 [Fusobacteriaceae bacterium]